MHRCRLQMRMLLEEARALRERDRMRQDIPHGLERDVRRGDERMVDAQERLSRDREVGFEQEVVIAVDRPGETVLDRRDAAIRGRRLYSIERLFKGVTRHRLDVGTEESLCGC